MSEKEYFTYEFTDSGRYEMMLIATSADGCIDTVFRTLNNRLKQTMFIPAAFSPNGDGLNDVFGVFGEAIGPENYELVIYDRWGKEVFLSKNPFYGWDGSVQNGNMATNGTYPYVLRYTDEDNEKRMITGQVIVIRSNSKNITTD